MEPQFWHQRWNENRIGFHQSDVNKTLIAFWPQLRGQAQDESANGKTCVFVPLCGKSLDMLWLHQQGHQVLGSELSAKAAQAFFTENNLSYEQQDYGEFVHFVGTAEAYGITILAGDFFKLTPAHTASCPLFYDRAALIAMNPDLRGAYAEQLTLLSPAGSQGLLLSMSYDQTRMPGPPFSVTDENVNQLLSSGFEIEEVAHYTGADRVGNLTKRGLETLDERVYLLSRKL